MGIKQLSYDNLRKLSNKYGDVSVMENSADKEISAYKAVTRFTHNMMTLIHHIKK